MSDDTLIDAIEQFKLAPESLTDQQIAVIARADTDLGKRARERRRQATSEAMGAAVATVIKQALVERDLRIAELERRLLDVEATEAARRELVP